METPEEQSGFIEFEPFSTVILQKVAEAADRKSKNAVFESVINDARAEVINSEGNTRTTLYANHRGLKSKHWNQTKQMAFDLNKAGIDVAFLPEFDDETSADGLLKIGKTYRIVDFKYSSTDNYNTIATEIEKGLSQTRNFVLKLDLGNLATMENVVNQLIRKRLPMPNFIIISKYGKAFDVSSKDILIGKYKDILRGQL